MCVCVCVCVCMRARALRIVSTDKILRFINALIAIIIVIINFTCVFARALREPVWPSGKAL